jgi:hypothetical protein
MNKNLSLWLVYERDWIILDWFASVSSNIGTLQWVHDSKNENFN